MLGELRLDTMNIHIYDSFLQGHFYDRLVQQGHIQNFKKQVVALLDSINYWQNRGIPRIDVDLEFIMETWVPQQSGPLGDCAVWYCLLLRAFGSQAFANYNALPLYAHLVSYVLFGNQIPPIILGHGEKPWSSITHGLRFPLDGLRFLYAENVVDKTRQDTIDHVTDDY
ncbi:hypothetical protein L2E82_16170 [Cichorium intybus]|uniref:Uncharacterized protein n=1 Tax=Cichorium intybus TaxID=13427 RepID=A0ACB9F5A9_CICIN|nr:hypothetical protein L2E82_16170 [Cichorium intybus]